MHLQISWCISNEHSEQFKYLIFNSRFPIIKYEVAKPQYCISQDLTMIMIFLKLWTSFEVKIIHGCCGWEMQLQNFFKQKFPIDNITDIYEASLKLLTPRYCNASHLAPPIRAQVVWGGEANPHSNVFQSPPLPSSGHWLHKMKLLLFYI